MHSGIVLKKQADLFSIETDQGISECVARKNLKKEGIFVGDNVLLDEDGAIFKVQTRKNILIRPPVANIDKMFIVIAPVPKADFYTVDKLLIFCTLNNIKPILCINKNDLDSDFCEKTKKTYSKICKTLVFSTIDESVKILKKEIKGICVLAGQSAVGKSSIINSLVGENVAKTDDFSKKIERGKQTTRTVQLYKFGKGNFLADTAGFSKLDESLLDLKEDEVKYYFEDFLPYAEMCKYKSCLHTNSKDCGVFEAVKDGEIDKNRYENYLKLYQTIKSIKKF